MRDGLIVLVVIVSGLLSALGAVAFLQYAYERGVECPAFGRAVERPTKYTWWGGGCFVQDINGRWVTSSNYDSVGLTP